MNCERELSKNFGGGAIYRTLFNASFRFPEAKAQRDFFFIIPQFPEKLFDLIHASSRFANHAQGGASISAPGFDALEQQTFEFAAISRPFGVDVAAAAIEGGARLEEFLIFDF